jgi:hypothetical protein
MAKAPIKSVPAVTIAAREAGAVMARWQAVELAAQAVSEARHRSSRRAPELSPSMRSRRRVG